jgi:PAS domain S-box-containing protein
MNVYHIIEAVGLLVAGVVFYSYAYDWVPPGPGAAGGRRAALLGAAFGALTVALMVARIEVGEGSFIDARLVPVALIGLFEGWPAALLAAAMGAVYRVWLGGRGVLPGVGALFATVLAAGLVHAWSRREGRLRVRHVAALAGSVYGVTAGAFLSLGPRGVAMFEGIWLSYLAMTVLGIGGLARLFHDVAAQRRLAAERERFRAIVDETRDAIRIVDARRHAILDANRADGELSGLAPAELIGRDERAFWPAPPDPAAWQPPDARGTAHARGVPFRRVTGEVVTVDATRHRVAYRSGIYDIVVFRAAADRLAAEDALREAAELRAAGLLARAAAHEINNPLAVILGYLQMLAPRVSADARAAEWTEHMKQAALRIRDAVGRLNRIVKIETTEATGGAVVMLDTERSSAPAGEAPPAGGAAPPR